MQQAASTLARAASTLPPVTVQAAPAAESATARQGNGHCHDCAGDVVIVGAVRTANCRAKKGGFKDAYPDDLVVAVLKEVLERTGVKPEEVDDVCFGSVFPSTSKRASECCAGLQSIANLAAAIQAGYIDIGIAGGIEFYTKDPLYWQGSDNPKIEGSKHAQDVGLALGLTAENVAEKFHVEREVQDRFAAASHAKAAAAQASGKFDKEIVPVKVMQKDSSGETKEVVVAADDSIRADSTFDSLSKASAPFDLSSTLFLKPYFKKGGTVTAGNCCSNTDCAAAVLMMNRAEAERRGLPILATLRSFATGAVEPGTMGTAPLVAVPKALERAGISKEEVEVFELNEAFASQFAYCMEQLGVPEEKVNPNGGAIALGHPAGATGVRQTVTLLHELARRQESGDPERVDVGLELKKAVFEAYRANDPAELHRHQLKESQYLISCTIHDLQHPTASSPLPPQFHAASPQLLRGLQADLAHVNQQLEQDHLVPAAAPTAEERED
ncbi:3-ketoacyl- thiolase peroxisomal [Chlorella sorokiniana]|uniref:3-ketoacyl-thiolase peroxisomal n=1 Tax=Chlorella sorokiniana TaxID=3076 RepID=A0A2P6TUX9_CHLSO|nr:3-ketoacyl- thiolase peroxisomal [Chlorella sorokiniana]|eukprot:PRW57879.1 3-ketoacyl- thiolase peroxisomal [Chlorella sorokiniana]